MNKIKTNFTGQTIFVGMDVHKNSWNLGIHLNTNVGCCILSPCDLSN